MASMRGTSSASLLGTAALGLLWAGCGGEINRPVIEDKHETCVTSDQCPSGEVCKEGLCIIGDCVVRTDCPKPDDQLCNELNRCIPDPDSPIGNECPNGDRDCDMGEFCSAGNCYSVADSESCARSSDCAGGERCDPVSNFCVEDRGGCNRASEYPELACPDGEGCNAVTGHCEPLQGAECTAATQEEDCPPDLLCIGGRCVQCTANASCDGVDNICCEGFGTQCNVATGRCVSAFVCTAHEDCTDCLVRPGLDSQSYCSDGRSCTGSSDCAHLSNRRCATSTGECIQPECVEDDDCSYEHDARWTCNPATMRCFLPPATCTEDNEPNNAIATAIPVAGAEHSDLLCRGDVDVLEIQGHANTRLRATVGFSPSSANGNTVALRDAAGVELDSATVSWTSTVSVAADISADAAYYVSIGGNATEYDEYNYTITIAETEPLECDAELGEPNETIEEASNSILTQGTHPRALCGVDDEDYHQLTAPAGMRTVITATFIDADGDIDIRLMDLDGTTLDSSTGVSDSEEVRYTAGDVDETLVLRVWRYSGAEEQEYQLELTAVEPPTCDDPYEPNEQESSAAPAGAGSFAANICNIEDHDFFQISLPGGGDISATLSFTDADGNLQLALREAGGYSVDTSTGYEDSEFVEGLALDPGLYFLDVYSSSYSYPEPEAQPYDLEIAVAHACFDDVFEGWGNNSIEQATPIRDEALASFALEETLKFCGDDDDWFRLILLGDESVALEASGPEGIFAELYRETEAGAERVALSRAAPGGDPGKVILDYPVPGRGALYYLRLGQSGIDEQSYILKLLIASDPCPEDPFEFNDVLEHASPVSGELLEGSAVLCPARDLDLFRVPLLAGTQVDVSASFNGDDGDLDLIATVADAEVAAARSANTAGPATELLSYSATEAGDLILMVHRSASSTAGHIPYDLVVDVVGGVSEDAGMPEDSGMPEDGGLDAGSGVDGAS